MVNKPAFFEAGVGAEHHRHVEVVGDHAQPAVLQQRTRDFFVGGAEVDEQRGIVGNEACDTRGDMLLFAGLQRFQCGVGQIFHAGGHADAAMIAAQHAGIAQQGQIVPDRLRCHLKAGGQAFHIGKALLPHRCHQLFLARVQCRRRDSPVVSRRHAQMIAHAREDANTVVRAPRAITT
ncbi:hypothetical protein ADT27_01520 [Xanthomonas oryzae]|nr:hypothetical protein BE73_00770 [Xanthomonas oryzae pv. oryzicola]AKN99277.1 hypothetical protein ACU15_00660 [Xanthomonas oryzae pv. oryzicola]KOR52199.1 hypothetical protein ADT27_01520 [Xanthomonas oryzae]QEO95164.1 hypothetical protein XOCgx_0168 [Xanthomonas oryzae pv. oryzicola]